jgi:hypothetical protein
MLWKEASGQLRVEIQRQALTGRDFREADAVRESLYAVRTFFRRCGRGT